MPATSLWARIRTRADLPLRHGAWYRVVELDARTATLAVNSRLVRCRRPLLQILPIRPPAWTVVPRARGDAAPGDRYGVCPSCCARERLEPGTRTRLCRRCGGRFAVIWSETSWRPFEILGDAPDERLLARVRAAALAMLATAVPARPAR